MKAALAYLRRPMVPGRFLDSLTGLLLREAERPAAERVFGRRIFGPEWPPYPNTGRRALVRQFLAETPPEVDRLLMADDDNTFKPWDPEDLLSLVDESHPIVSGLYFAWDAGPHRARPLLMNRDPDGKATYLWDYPASAYVERDVVGMGFCGILRSVLEEWLAVSGNESWFDYDENARGGFVIEDGAFCARMKSIGKKIYVHTGIKIGHMKLVEVGERDARQVHGSTVHGSVVRNPSTAEPLNH